MKVNKLTMGAIALGLLIVAIGVNQAFSVYADGFGADEQTQGANVNPDDVEVKFGALSSPMIPSPFLNWGGVSEWRSGNDLRTATSTLCALQSPAATSTLRTATLRVDSLPYELAYVAINRGSTAFSSSTRLAIKDPWTTSELGYLVATSSAGTFGGLVDGVVLPNSWITFTFSTTTVVNANFQPTGKCSVSFLEI